MKFDSVDSLGAKGFVGFKSVRDLFLSCSEVPDERGNYLVLYLNGHCPKFVNPGVGLTRHKDQILNYTINCLEKRWVAGTIVVYIGQAGGKSKKGEWSDETLNSRINTYMKYGQGHDVPHRGGRSIWQIQDYQELVLCWKPLPNKMKCPKQVEGEMIREFRSTYDEKRPFANLQG